jgi:hypothetical protein
VLGLGSGVVKAKVGGSDLVCIVCIRRLTFFPLHLRTELRESFFS